MRSFRTVNRLMGTAHEKQLQAENGDFDDQLEAMLNAVDPYWQDREETEMDIFRRTAPLVRVQTDDGYEIQPGRTSREGSETPRQVVATELIPIEGPTLEEIE